MADDKDDSGLLAKLGGNGVLWLVLTAFGAVALQRAPLLVEHPLGSTSLAAARQAEVSHESRLWQDPFEVVPTPRSSAAPHSGELTPEAGSRLASVVLQHAPSPLILVASVPDGVYAEAVERRRRIRVAVVEGLMAEGLVAEDAQALHLAGPVPFEWFVAPPRLPYTVVTDELEKGIPSAVLVLWIAESSLGTEPRATLLRTLGPVGMPLQAENPDARDRAVSAGTGRNDTSEGPRVVVLGPASSQTLQALLLSEHPDPTNSKPGGPEPPLPHFFTAMASLGVRTIPADARGDRSAGAVPGANHGLASAGITRTIADDEQVARALVDELSLRSVNPFKRDELAWTVRELVKRERDPSDDAVALVTEVDTPYGRAMPGAFCRSFRHQLAALKPAQWRCEDDPETGKGLVLFGYLRGLNGEVHRGPVRLGPDIPGTTPESADAHPGDSDAAVLESAAGQDTSNRSGNTIERSEGNAQTDYLERLADRLADLDQSLRRDSSNPRALRAIGLLGTDVYDKLMLLRALKPRFPGAVFFTTDLDARLLDAAELPFTRNLVVGSSYGLRLADPKAQPGNPAAPIGQHGFADFRDAYQTATFLTTRVAVRVPDGRLTSEQRACLRLWTQHIHLYEVGRSGPNELVPAAGTGPGPDDTACHASGWGDVQPQAGGDDSELSLRQRAGLCLTFLALVFTYLQWSHPPTRAWLERLVASGHASRESVGMQRTAVRLWLVFWAAVAGAFALAALLAKGWPWLATRLSDQGAGQPLQLASGASVWPAMLLVAVAAGYWLSVLARTTGQLEDNAREIHEWLQLPGKFGELVSDLKAQARNEHFVQRWARHMFPPSLLPPMPGNGIPPFWRAYLRGGLAVARVHRWLVLGGLMLVVFWVLNDPLGNHLPLRGRYVDFAYTTLNNIALGVLMFLMISVADASLFCTDFLDHLSAADGEWPAHVLDHLAQVRGLRREVALPWLRVELAARRSAAITPMIYHPFLFIAVLIVSHSTLFSPWRISLQQLVVVAATALAMLFCASKLRVSAEAVRTDCLDRLGAELQRLQGWSAPPNAECEQLRGLLRLVNGDRRGALAPFSQQPLIRSLILPLISLAGTSAADLASLWQ